MVTKGLIKIVLGITVLIILRILYKSGGYSSKLDFYIDWDSLIGIGLVLLIWGVLNLFD